jgi:hypothetical protein
VVKGSSDKLKKWLKNRNVPLVKIANRWHCAKQEAMTAFPRHSAIRDKIKYYGKGTGAELDGD